MQIDFTKMHGAGNDFVMIDNLDASVRLSPDQIAGMLFNRDDDAGEGGCKQRVG